MSSCGETRSSALARGSEKEERRLRMVTVMDGSWGESSEEKLEQGSVPGSQIQQT